MKRILLIAGLSAALCWSAVSLAVSDIEVVTADGDAALLGEFFESNKWTLVLIWTTYCEVCRGQFPMLDALHQMHRDGDLKVLGVAADGRDAAPQVQRELLARDVSFLSVVSDAPAIAAALGAMTGEPLHGTPTYLLIDGHGRLAARINGPVHPEAIEQYLQHEHP